MGSRISQDRPTPMNLGRAGRALVAVACVAVAVGAALWLWQLPGFRRQVALSTTHQPIPFTELYFTDPNTLPKHLLSGQPNMFNFTIANHEAKTVTYTYVVTAQTPFGTSEVTRDQVTIADGARRVVTVESVPPVAGITYLITVHLVGRSETIHFTGAS